MKILVLADVPPAVIGGAEVQALRLSRCWASAGHEVIVAGPKNVPHVEHGLRVLRIPTIRATRLLRGVSYLFSTLWLLRAERDSYDLIYCRFVREQAFVASVAKLCFGLRRPLVACTACAEDPRDVASAAALQRSRAGKLMLQVIRRGADRVNALSRVIAEELLNVGFSAQRVTRIPNGAIIPEMLVSRSHHDETEFRILFVGRLTQQKGVDVLLRALAALGENDRDHRPPVLDVVGGGPLREDLEQLATSLGIADRVFFHGVVPNERVAEYFTRANLFVLPSRFEGMPGVLLEACAHGLPAIATRVSGSEEILESAGGWLVPSDDVPALTSALSSAVACRGSELTEIGSAARKSVMERYDIRNVSDEYLRLFEVVCGEVA